MPHHAASRKSIPSALVTLKRKRATGPRTLAGKSRSKLNSTKHGIFSTGILIGSELQSEYDEHSRELHACLSPVGMVEHLLVDKLAMLVWRYRRVLRAEAAEISIKSDAQASPDPLHKQFLGLMAAGSTGLIFQGMLTRDGGLLTSAISSLREISKAIESKGPDWERDFEDLKRIYGKAKSDHEPDEGQALNGALPERYHELAKLRTSDSRTEISELFEVEIMNLEDISGPWLLRDSELRERRAMAAVVPSEQLQRYEVSLERAFDRTLTQLERVQRMRLGLAVLPPLKVELSG